MKSNSNFPQHCRKNIGYHQDEKAITSSTNLNNFSSGRYDKSKITEDKSYQKYINNPNKVDNKLKNKNQLKKQLNIIMHDAKIRKAYSPAGGQIKTIEDTSLQNKGSNRMISPQNQKTTSYKIKSRDDHSDKKKINVIPQQGNKKAPTWLNKKAKNEPNTIYNNSITKYEKNKSRQNKNDSSVKMQKNKLQNQNNIKNGNNLQTVSQTSIEEAKRSKGQTNDWKKVYESNHLKGKNPQQKSEIYIKDDTNTVETNTNLEINKVILEKQIAELKFQLENALEDKNILINRLETIEMQLVISNRKVDEWKQIENTYRSNQKFLKETIAELQDKLITSRQSKNRELTSDISKFYGEGVLCDRELLSKKNQQISRLNEMIITNRNKVTDANNQISREKIKNIKLIQNIENKYEALIQQKHQQIQDLKLEIEKFKGQIGKLNHQLEGKNKIIKDHLLSQIAKDQDSTYIHSFIDKYLGEENAQGRSSELSGFKNENFLIVNSPSSHI